ncbi:50S ribosomal protein L28 [archaeon]|nr:MAG: 50S ribosomal protein L28 [archaeon]
MFHGKDVRFGHSISHSMHHTKRSWQPNVQNKRLWSDALNDWVRFKITTAGIKAVDNYGGIDNYILGLDEKLVQDSNYITKMRGLIATAVFHKGELPPKMIKKLGYDKNPPSLPTQQGTQL